MKRFKPVFLFIISMFILSACSLPGKATTSTNTNKAQQETQSNEKKGFSLKDALSLGQSTKCTYTVDSNEVTTLIKGNKMRVDGLNNNPENKETAKGGAINDGEWVYFWDGTSNKGMKYNLAKMEELNKENEASSSTTEKEAETWSKPEQWAQDIEGKYQVDCQPAVIADSAFNPPADVTFEDMAAILDMAKQFQNIKPEDMKMPDLSTQPTKDTSEEE